MNKYLCEKINSLCKKYIIYKLIGEDSDKFDMVNNLNFITLVIILKQKFVFVEIITNYIGTQSCCYISENHIALCTRNYSE